MKSEPGLPEPALLRQYSNLASQTSPPPFLTEWEEAVRRTVWQPGYIPQPEPPGRIHNLQYCGYRIDRILHFLLNHFESMYELINQKI
jgi:hypothetical protein